MAWSTRELELTGFVRQAAPVEVAPELTVAGELSAADRAFVVVMSRVISAPGTRCV
ncbi:hypothetical protein [Nocardia sp. XZ_19_385]|uniref:hypothetical protein n=1 Tax=Nocardia sp. XZ_19_385 TaxID=2769488 RepID=UPI00188FEFDD|nr:hypothetical protein [Nocardia sp. XZ_19_385]